MARRPLAIVTDDPIGPEQLREIGSAYLPGLSRGDFAGMVAGIFGTIVVAILAGVVTVDNGAATGRAAAAILIAIGIALITLPSSFATSR